MDYSSMHQNMVGVSSCSSQDNYHNQKKPSVAIRPAPPEQSLRCPRCDSTNTKFCYYNNYSLSQPRYFCKSCRRYWTKGGILRNIPIGGAYRKHKRSSSVTKSLRTTPEPTTTHDGKTFQAVSFGGYNNNINNEQMELGLAFALLNKQPLGVSSHLGFPSEFGNSQMNMEGVYGTTSQQMENAGYAFGNGGGGLEQIATSDPNKVLWGFPWQMNMGGGGGGGGGSGHVDQIDSGRQVWSNTFNYINTGALL
ncbi:Dof zinc finger protein DOF3.2 [Cardamine amara subsp. amara]|uniref:Dof zinc finger protein n=1 Tax=Cardamine amara subsp. amara TaxID=228776 RepID=A0ABD1A8V2_CARAN